MSWISGLVDGFSGIMRFGTRTSIEQGQYVGRNRERVDEGTVLALSAAWACVNLVAGTIATLPLMVYRPVTGGREVARDHWLYRILHDDPNAEQTDVEFWEFMAAAVELRGNGFAEKLRGAGGQVVGLEPIPPGIVARSRRDSGEIEYRWTLNGRSRVETADNVLHLRGFGGDPLGGLSTIAFGSRMFGLAMGLNRSADAVFDNAVLPSGVYQTEAKLNADQVKEIEGRLALKYQGAINAGRPMVLGHDLKWQQLTMQPDDLQMLESRGFSVEEVCRWFGVPPHMVGHTSGNTQLGSSITDQTRGFEKFSLRRRLKRIEKSLRKQLLTPEDVARGITVEFNLDGLLQGSPGERSAFYNAGLQNGWFTINEVRAKENMPPVEGGDVPRMQMQNMPITMTAAPATINASAPSPAQ